MKTTFPLFFRILLWFFLNLLVVGSGLALMFWLQFGSMNNWLLPESSQAQIQAMCVVLTGDLANSERKTWGTALARLSEAYQMDFALFDGQGRWLAGAGMDLPEKVRQKLVYPLDRPPSAPAPSGPGMSPAWAPPSLDPRPLDPLPTSALNRPPPAIVPDFPKTVVTTEQPTAYWLLVRLPPEKFQVANAGPAILVGTTPSLGVSPLLFNPRPWFAVAGGIILFCILFWFPFARNLTSSIATMTLATEAIAEGRFDIHVTDSRRDELGRLGGAINRMTGRLKDFVTGQKRFLGDVAHELCSPLARMEIALGILEENSEEKSLQHVRDVREEVTHMRKLATELLSFSKASMGENRVKLEPVSVAEIVEQAVRLETRAACAIETEVPADLKVQANAELLLRAVANLLRNAVRYAGAAGPISVRAWRDDESIRLTVSDQGPGVPAREIDKLFDPFYRVDESRTSATGGVGLGLAIVKSCVEACKGTARARNREPHGLEVRIRLNPAEAG